MINSKELALRAAKILDEKGANDIEILLVLEPLDTYGCIKTTGICENDFFLAHGCFLSPLVAS